jgi:peptidoglycan/xylan/chitin deacetylase (PgdA/CDA1 family)
MPLRSFLLNLLFNLGAAGYLRRRKDGEATIVSLHRVTPESDPFFEPISPQAFDTLLGYLGKYYSFVDFADLPTLKAGMKKPPLLLSFDDGHHDFIEYALPILKKHGIRANQNIVNNCAAGGIIWTDRLNFLCETARRAGVKLSFFEQGLPISLDQCGGNWIELHQRTYIALLHLNRQEREAILEHYENKFGARVAIRMMNWDDIRQCSEYGIEIGSHTYSHDSLPTITDEALLDFELRVSRVELEEKIQKPVSIVAFPNGQGSKHVDEAAVKAGFTTMLYVENATNPISAEMASGTLFRVGVSNESLAETALRIELFHKRFRS